ncbi:gene transfer agent family protein [Mongoliimonas terrestris]|uniref:gene transfer agent family protein n=1 Tax=Mongoliimonas terrestris TaxID=1709001 RepID=UPI000949A69A|nr:gene transfer agent family protein [Mongoliimonas terrestris]
MNDDDSTAVTLFFGDGTRRFNLSADVMPELEAQCGGIGALVYRFHARPNVSFTFADLLTVLRLGLIGGGTPPQVAARIVDTYAARRPVVESFPVALAVLNSKWFGAAATEADIAQAEADAKTDDALSNSIAEGN